MHLKNIKHIHFIGVGGVSMSGIALILANHGYTVSGSDRQRSKLTAEIEAAGIQLFIGHAPSHISGADLVVYSAAIHDDNPEYKAAKENNLPLLSRAQMLGLLMKDYKNSINVAGTHGKTTTTGMITRMVNDAQCPPTVLAGTYNQDLKSHVQVGDHHLLITEACEYTRSFLNFYPTIGVILNIEEDHLDYYKDLEEIEGAFIDFAKNTTLEGCLVTNYDDPLAKKLIDHFPDKAFGFGFSQGAHYQAKNVAYSPKGHGAFDLYIKGHKIKRVQLKLPGQHNIANALAAIAACDLYKVDLHLALERLEDFTGVSRRFEFKGTLNEASIFDEYAHHPSELKTTLKGISNIQGFEGIYCIFQPHTFSRTKELLKEFSEAFDAVDQVILADIYPSREEDPGDIHSKDLLDLLLKRGVDAKYFDSFEAIVDYLKPLTHKKNLLLTAGAGDIYKVGEALVED